MISVHCCTDVWRVREEDLFIMIEPLLSTCIKTRKAQLIDHQDIAWKCMDKPTKKIDARYHSCDFRYPEILVEGVSNPFDRRYRMVDGSHRMAKMYLETDIRQSFYYLISKEEFYGSLLSYEKVRAYKTEMKKRKIGL